MNTANTDVWVSSPVTRLWRVQGNSLRSLRTISRHVWAKESLGQTTGERMRTENIKAYVKNSKVKVKSKSCDGSGNILDFFQYIVV